MRTYLQSFLESCHYDPQDAQVLLAAYDRVADNRDAAGLWQQALALYDADAHCDYSQILRLADQAAEETGLQEYTLELLIFLCMTKKAGERYRQRGLAPEIFRESMLDLRYKLEECKAVYGIVGSFVAGWFPGFFDLTRFALGRLQFEMRDFGRFYENADKRLTPESRVINVHIPRTGTPLDPESCDRSFRLAKEFFREETGPVCAFVCDSWLLYPENREILSPTSNTHRFLSRFDIIEWDIKKNRGDLWRLFDTKETNPDRLPADTSFRRRYVQHLKRGGKVGSGYGVFFL